MTLSDVGFLLVRLAIWSVLAWQTWREVLATIQLQLLENLAWVVKRIRRVGNHRDLIFSFFFGNGEHLVRHHQVLVLDWLVHLSQHQLLFGLIARMPFALDSRCTQTAILSWQCLVVVVQISALATRQNVLSTWDLSQISFWLLPLLFVGVTRRPWFFQFRLTYQRNLHNFRFLESAWKINIVFCRSLGFFES